MSENEFTTPDGRIMIFNGGDPLPGCPEDWKEVPSLEKKLNNGIERDDDEYDYAPRWRFDCGFKLDFDGPIIRVSSRFYPPKNHYGPTWDGSVTVYFMDQEIAEKEFDCPTLDKLKIQVDAYLKEICDKIRSIFPPLEQKTS